MYQIGAILMYHSETNNPESVLSQCFGMIHNNDTIQV
jgi:hypothetical protein